MEKLCLKGAENFTSLNGIEELSLIHLDLSLTDVEDISTHASVYTLESIDIQKCAEIGDLSILMQLNNLKEIKADKKTKSAKDGCCTFFRCNIKLVKWM